MPRKNNRKINRRLKNKRKRDNVVFFPKIQEKRGFRKFIFHITLLFLVLGILAAELSTHVNNMKLSVLLEEYKTEVTKLHRENEELQVTLASQRNLFDIDQKARLFLTMSEPKKMIFLKP